MTPHMYKMKLFKTRKVNIIAFFEGLVLSNEKRSNYCAQHLALALVMHFTKFEFLIVSVTNYRCGSAANHT